MTAADPILMIEDDAGHAVLIERNIRRAGVQNPIRHCRDGTSAMEALGQLLGTPEALPSLVFLDLNLPDMSGTDILDRIRHDRALRQLIVIILTTTDDKDEINRCYDMGCNLYLTKPLEYRGFCDVVGRMARFLSLIQCPEPPRS